MGDDTGSGWMMLAGGVMMIAILFFMGRSLPEMLKRSEEAPKDWMGLAIPLIFVVVLVFVVVKAL